MINNTITFLGEQRDHTIRVIEMTLMSGITLNTYLMMEEGNYSTTLIYISSTPFFWDLNSEFMWILETHMSIVNVSVKSGEYARFFVKSKLFCFF